MTPRPYQLEAKLGAYAALRQGRSAIVVMPTGTGKGAVIGQITADAVKASRRVLIMVHRKEIVDQLAEHVRRWSPGTEPAIERAQQREATDETPVVVASVQSLARRLDHFERGRFDLIIYDESHHALASQPRAVFDYFASAKLLGFTATPNRGDEKALGQVFDAVGYDMTLGDAILGGWLVPLRSQQIELKSLDLSKVRKRSGELAAGDLGDAMSEVEVLREAIDPALDIAADRQALIFTVTRAHMRCVVETIRQRSEVRGLDLPIAHVDGTTPKDDRDRIMADFRAGAIRWLVNVEVATEGFDAPKCDTVILLRPTLSQALLMQMIGRGTRPLAGIVDAHDTAADRRAAIKASAKSHALILDFTDNTSRHDLASPLDLLGGDYTLPQRREAERLVEDGTAEDLIEALEMVRAKHEARLLEQRARLGDPLALFGLHAERDRWGRAPTRKQRAVLDPLKIPRRLDIREANVVLEEISRRELARLCSYDQAALLARLGHEIAPIKSMTRREASALVRAAAKRGWRRR